MGEQRLNPTPHPTLPGHFLIPVLYDETGRYNVYISEDKARFYTDANLPDCVKAQLGLIRGRARGIVIDPEVPEIGVRLTPACYAIVLTKKQVQALDTGKYMESNYGQR
jgi:hypothetical protein